MPPAAIVAPAPASALTALTAFCTPPVVVFNAEPVTDLETLLATAVTLLMVVETAVPALVTAVRALVAVLIPPVILETLLFTEATALVIPPTVPATELNAPVALVIAPPTELIAPVALPIALLAELSAPDSFPAAPDAAPATPEAAPATELNAPLALFSAPEAFPAIDPAAFNKLLPACVVWLATSAAAAAFSFAICVRFCGTPALKGLNEFLIALNADADTPFA